MATRLERLMATKDFPQVEAVIAFLRSRSPALVPTSEIARVFCCSQSKARGFVKYAREFLELTTGEFIPNQPKRKTAKMFGYMISKNNRLALFESLKSGDRANGHLATEARIFSRVSRPPRDNADDLELWLTLQHRVEAGQLRLRSSERVKEVLAQRERNALLSAASSNQTKTPWEELGLDSPEAYGE